MVSKMMYISKGMESRKIFICLFIYSFIHFTQVEPESVLKGTFSLRNW